MSGVGQNSTFGPSDYHSIVFPTTTRKKLKNQKRTERDLSMLKIAFPLLSMLCRGRSTAHQQSQGLIVPSNKSGSGSGRASNLDTSQLMNRLINLKASSSILALVLRGPRNAFHLRHRVHRSRLRPTMRWLAYPSFLRCGGSPKTNVAFDCFNYHVFTIQIQVKWIYLR